MDKIREFEEKVRNSGWYRLIGMKPKLGDKTIVELEVSEKHHQALGTAHGGVLASILDSAAGLAVNRELYGSGKIAVTAEMKVNYLKPVRNGKVVAEGEVVSWGSKIVVATSKAYQNDELVAICTVTMYIVEV
ncbi:hypothetical protein Asulf_01158 [Archaeoglobus sulfaticallidus PM70-1]|uniref:Thioesterase domain-containing protein n=1 Tax=Archaeoglobus sulfaticallidus PM70-1 TaxID=387631 RepID=N0BFU3_9EURY|nr:PaaI family thioesterase [Archaeoglobus sulfaticallidus]AGK61157.1 hypothetical protein Asulf_01158 [Archaeoglobus sulfaticallidus PM70-1]